MYRFGLIGEKLSHSFSPFLHQELMKKNGIEGTYSLIEIPRDKFSEEFFAIKQGLYDGLNVTIPYKELIIPLLDELSPQAAYIGAVNTVEFRDGKAIGHNTDYDGFLSMLDDEYITIKDASAVLLGSGGVTKAVIKALLDREIGSITIVSTHPNKEQLFRTTSYEEYIDSRIPCDLLINCTPVGMYPAIDASPLPASAIHAKTVIDLIYNPAETRLLQDAAQRGAKTVNGLKMLEAQAAKAEEIWLEAK